MGSIFNDDNVKMCENCEFYRPSATDEREVLCSQRGVVIKGDVCKKYKYDPFKRQPKTNKMDVDFKKEDFEL